MMRASMVFLVAAIAAPASGCQALLGIDDVTGVTPDGSVVDAPVSRQYRKKITIDSSRVESPLGQDSLANFPVLVALVDSDVAARAQAAGDDIHFTDQAGVALAHEIEIWEPGSARLVAWVKLSELSSAVDTELYIHYGGPGAETPHDPAAVWSSGFVAVWHLGEDPAQAVRDSLNTSHGTAGGGMGPDDVVPAQVGQGLDLDGIDDEITFENRLVASSPHTISAWVNQRSAAAGQSMLMALGDGSYNQARWLKTSDGGGQLALGFYSNDWNVGGDIRESGWRLVHWTYEASVNVIYVDGALTALGLLFGVSTAGTEGIIGNAREAFGSNLNLDGQIDEIRISNVARSAAWIATEYRNQSAPASFLAIGEEEAL
jgi:hypothetical protein